jgi:hypothetical protein
MQSAAAVQNCMKSGKTRSKSGEPTFRWAKYQGMKLKFAELLLERKGKIHNCHTADTIPVYEEIGNLLEEQWHPNAFKGTSGNGRLRQEYKNLRQLHGKWMQAKNKSGNARLTPHASRPLPVHPRVRFNYRRCHL